MPDLSRLLNPKALAVVGGKECERVIEQCDKFGFEGDIWPVHPKRDTMRGRPCFRTIEDLPSPPDAAYVAVNRERTIDIVRSLSQIGSGGAVCYAAGFAETESESSGAKDLQNELVKAAGEMPIIGPNCYGFINGVSGASLWPDQHGARRCESGVSIVTQSSNIAINLTMQQRGLPIAFMMTAGNQAQTGLSTLAFEMLENESVTALGLHIEGLDGVQQFEKLANRARVLHKPIVVLKVGKSAQAQAATITHTASLAGSDKAHRALFKRFGVAQVETLEEFIETLKLLHNSGPLSGNALLSLSCSGGEASLMADAAEGRVVEFPAFSDDDARTLKAELGPLVTVSNPLDYNTYIWGNWPAMTRMFEAALAPKFDLALLVMDFPRADICDDFDWRSTTDAFIAATKSTNSRTAVVSSLPETMPEAIASDLMNKGVVPLCGLPTALCAVEKAFEIGVAWRKTMPPPLLNNPPKTTQKPFVLDEAASKEALNKFGLVTPNGVVITKGDTVSECLKPLQHPYAVKALGIAHKTEAGGVKLGLKSVEEVQSAISEMNHLGDRFLVEEMAGAPLAELLVGITRDPVCGLMLTLGAGGVLTEILDDTATLLLPATETDIRDALNGLKIGRVLDGYRSSDAVDIDALIANILCVASYACAHVDTLQELDINPLFATQFGSVAVDALIVENR